MEDFNRTAHPFAGKGRLLHDFVRAGMARTPGSKVALEEGQRGELRTTFEELGRLVSQLAGHLAAAGVRRETLVGIWMPRGRLAIVCALAVLEAGGAYLPCDEALPADRASYMLEVKGGNRTTTTTNTTTNSAKMLEV